MARLTLFMDRLNLEKELNSTIDRCRLFHTGATRCILLMSETIGKSVCLSLLCYVGTNFLSLRTNTT